MNQKYFILVLFLSIGLYIYSYPSTRTSKIKTLEELKINKSSNIRDTNISKENSDKFLIPKVTPNFSKKEVNSSLNPIFQINTLEKRESFNKKETFFLEVTPHLDNVGVNNEEGEGVAVSIIPLKNIGIDTESGEGIAISIE